MWKYFTNFIKCFICEIFTIYQFLSMFSNTTIGFYFVNQNKIQLYYSYVIINAVPYYENSVL